MEPDALLGEIKERSYIQMPTATTRLFLSSR